MQKLIPYLIRIAHSKFDYNFKANNYANIDKDHVTFFNRF